MTSVKMERGSPPPEPYIAPGAQCRAHEGLIQDTWEKQKATP